MKTLSSINSFIFKHIGLILAGIISYIVGVFFLKNSNAVIAVFVSIIILFIFIKYKKAFIYFMLTAPVQPMLWTLIQFQPGGSKYYSVNIGGMMLVFSFVFLVIALLTDKPQKKQYMFLVPAVLFVGITLVNMVRSPMLFEAFRGFVRFATPVLFYFFIILKVDDFKEAKRMMFFQFVVFLILVIFGDWQMLTHGFGVQEQSFDAAGAGALTTGEDVYRLSGGGGIIHPSEFGVKLIIYMVLALFIVFEPGVRYRWIYPVVILNMMFLLFNTYTRAAWASFVAVIMVIGIKRYRKLLFVSLLIGAFILISLPAVTHLIEARWGSQGSVKARFHSWEIAWDMFLEKPVFGHGMDAIRREHFKRRSFQAKLRTAERMGHGWGGNMVHNEYLFWLADGGIVSFMIAYYLIYCVLKLGFQLSRFPDPTAKNYATLLFAVAVTILVDGVSDHSFRYLLLELWAFTAFGEIYLRELRAKTQHETPAFS